MKALTAVSLLIVAFTSTSALAESRNDNLGNFRIQIATSDIQTAQNVETGDRTTRHFFTVEIMNAYLATSSVKLQNIASNGGNTSQYDEPDCPPLPTQTCADSWKVKTINPFVQTINPFE